MNIIDSPNVVDAVDKSFISNFCISANMSNEDLARLLNKYIDKSEHKIVLYSNRVIKLKPLLNKKHTSFKKINNKSPPPNNDTKLFILSYKSYITFEDMHKFLLHHNLHQFVVIDDICALDYKFSLKFKGTHNIKYKTIFFGCVLKYILITANLSIQQLNSIKNIINIDNTESSKNINNINNIKPSIHNHNNVRPTTWEYFILDTLKNGKRMGSKQILFECKKNQVFNEHHPIAELKHCSTQLLRLYRSNTIKRLKSNQIFLYYI